MNSAGAAGKVNNLVACALIALLLLSGCAIKRSGPLKDTIRTNIGKEPPSLDPHLGADTPSYEVLSNLMVGLTQFNNDLQCVQGCASSWESYDGGSRYVFHLNPKVKWSDGRPVVAADFQYSWTRLLDPATAAPYAFFLYDVQNGLEFNTGKIKDASKLGIRCLDDHTFEVRLTKPASYFINLTALCATVPLRKDVVEKYGSHWTDPAHMIVNGPFMMKEWKHEYKLELIANPLYYEGESKLKKIQFFMVPEQSTAFALYLNDQLDCIDNSSFPTPEVARYVGNPEYRNIALLHTHYIGFNVHKKPFDDKRVRLAVSMSLDRSIFPKILRRQERGTNTFISDGLDGYVPLDPPHYDPVAARKLLAEAGYPAGKDFPHVEILYPSREDSRLIMEVVQDQLKRNLQLQVQLTNQEFKVYMNNLHRDAPPIFLADWGADFPDPETFAGVFVSHNANNHTLWTSPLYDRLVSKAEGEQDPAARIKLYEQADHLLCRDEAAIACLYHGTENMLIKPWVRGLVANQIDLLFFKDSSIDNNWHE